VPKGPVNIPGAPPLVGVSPDGVDALVASAFAIWVFVQWVRKAKGEWLSTPSCGRVVASVKCSGGWR
jgi:hypothetical protein